MNSVLIDQVNAVVRPR